MKSREQVRMKKHGWRTLLSMVIVVAMLLSGAQAIFADTSSTENGTSSEVVSEESSTQSEQESVAEESAQSAAESTQTTSEPSEGTGSGASSSETTAEGTVTETTGSSASSTEGAETSGTNSEEEAAETEETVNTDSVTAANDNDDEETPDPTKMDTDILKFGFTQTFAGKDSAEPDFRVEVYETDKDYKVSGKNPVATGKTTGALNAENASYFVTDAVSYKAPASDTQTSEWTLYYVVKGKQTSNKEGWTYNAAEYHFEVKVEPVTLTGSNGAAEKEVYRVSSIRSVKKEGDKEEIKKLTEVDLKIEETRDDNGETAVVISNSSLRLSASEKDAVDYRVYTDSKLENLVDHSTGELKSELKDPTEYCDWVASGSGTDATYSYKVTIDTDSYKEGEIHYAVLVKAAKSGSDWVNEAKPIAILNLSTGSYTAVKNSDDSSTVGNTTGTADDTTASADTAGSTNSGDEQNTVRRTTWELTIPQLAFSRRKTETFTLTNKVSDGAPTETFTFTMGRRSSSGKSEPVTAKVKGAGTASFTKTFDKIGTYSYVISEAAAGTPGWTTDTVKYNIVYTVSDDGSGGFTFDKKIYKNAWSGKALADSNIVFNNTYVSGDYLFTAVDSDDSEKAVSGASFKLYGIKADYSTDSSSDYAAAVKHLKAGKVKSSELTELATVKSTKNGTVTLPDLVAGTSYVVEEENAAPGYQRSDGAVVLITRNSSGNLGVTAINSGDEIFSSKTGVWAQHPTKVDITMKSSTGALLTNAKLTLTDTTTGKTVDSWKSSASAHEVAYLVAGRKYEIEQTNKLVGYTKAETVTFEVTKKDVTTADYVQYVTVTSTKNSSTSGSSGSSGTSDGSGSGSGSTGTSAVKTGDTSQVIPLIIVMCAALVVILVIVFRRKKK